MTPEKCMLAWNKYSVITIYRTHISINVQSYLWINFNSLCNSQQNINYSLLFYFASCDVAIVVVSTKGDISPLAMKLLSLLGFVILELRKDAYPGNSNLARSPSFTHTPLIRKSPFSSVVVKASHWQSRRYTLTFAIGALLAEASRTVPESFVSGQEQRSLQHDGIAIWKFLSHFTVQINKKKL